MKISLLRSDLKEAVGICEKITGKNLNLPILGNILFDCENKTVKLFSTNLEIGVEVKIQSKTERIGKATIPAGIINNLISNMAKSDNVNLETQGNDIFVSSGNNSILIKSQPADDFPTLPDIKEENVFYMPAEDFISGLKSVWYSCSLSNIKPEISSVYLLSDKGTQLTFTATDSFRLAEMKFNYFFQNFGPILIPFKAIMEIIRIFDGRNGKVKISFNKNQINIEMDNIKLTSRLTDGIFPDYQQIIPKKFTSDVVVDKNSFIDSLKISSVFSNKLNEVDLVINPESNILTIKTSNKDVGDNTSNIPAKITGDGLKIAFNYKYVFDCLANINSQEIILRFSGENKPLLISGTNNDMFRYLVMPMSV